MTVKEIKEKLEKRNKGSVWKRAVKEDAIRLLDYFVEYYSINEGENVNFDVPNFAELRQGAKDWVQFSYGGCAYVWDTDIAQHYCTPSELKKVQDKEGGVKKPNSKENWLDVQARALFQAEYLIREALQS